FSAAPARARAGNLAWQATAFSAAANLHRMNLFARAGWKRGDWEPALSVLYTPADAGRSVTASVAWQGDRVHVETGVRINGGPGSAVLAQVPARRSLYTTLGWRF
ncbi:hypothetical protein, partial [Ramlibacter sp.]|uniref:hypothetical protein n=1 Tax=Ramlibacter sp. TaxID=1917967 RepID=UPI00183E2AB7